MTYFADAGGDINVLVTSTDESRIGSVRDAFLDVFKRATVKGIESQSQLAVQLVGIESAKQAAALRLGKLRENISVVPQNQVILVIESFLEEKLPNRSVSYLQHQLTKFNTEFQLPRFNYFF